MTLARRAARAALAITALIALLSVSPPAAAMGDPRLEWWTLETQHFRIHYPHTIEPVAQRVAALAEKVHGRASVALGYAPKSFTEIVLTDDTDSANGSATSLPYNTIRLFVTAPDDLSTLGDYDDWYLELVTHEYTHILHTDNISGLPAVVNAVLGKTLSPNQVQPRWILEGLAVLTESELTSAGRIRSSLFDMYLRADVLDDNIAGLDQFSSSAFRWPQGNLWYLYGSRFLRWISDIYGPNTMRAVAADYGATVVPWGINRSIRRATGRTYVELYEGFKDHLRRRYAEQVRQVEQRGLREGTRITFHGRTVYYPRFVPKRARAGDGEELIYFRDDQQARRGLYRLPLAAPKDGGVRREELVARTSATTTAAFTPDGDLVFNSISYYRNYYGRDDLFRIPRGETSPQGNERFRTRLTQGLRAYYADVSPDGKKIAFTLNTRGTTYLQIADLNAEGALENRRDLVPSARFDQAYTPRFSPDGKTLAYSAWSAGGFRDLRLVDVASGRFVEVTHDRALDVNPEWSPDGKTLYFASDRSGIFNVYAYDLATRKLAQVTNVRTGAVMPAVSTDGKTLAYVGYTSLGYDLYVMPLDPARFLPAPAPAIERGDPPDEPANVPVKKSRYSPLTTLAPRSYLVNYKPGNYSANAITLSARGADVVGLHAITGTLVIDPAAPEPSFSLDYSYDRLPVDLTARFFHSVVPRSNYRYGDRDITYDEYTNGVTTGVSYTDYGDFDAHTVGLSFNVAYARGNLPVGTKVDPYATTTIDPPGGNLNVVHLGYSYSNVEGGVESAGSARGVAVSVGLDFADRYTASDLSIYSASASFTAYLPMPWPWRPLRHHVLALRTAGAISGGSYARGSVYSVGGYDLENNSLPSAVFSGVFNGAFVLRGYPPRAYAGPAYFLQNAEYRFPIVKVDRGLSTLPLYLRRIDGNLFWDYGGAFQSFDFRKVRLFHDGAILDAPGLHTSVGGEVWINATLGYVINTQFRLGYAYGFSPEAIPGGQFYFIAASAF